MTEPRPALASRPHSSTTEPIYPEVEVNVRSLRPLVLISAVRYALRRAGKGPEQISRFSSEALTAPSPRRQRQICAHWVTVHT